MLDALIEIRDYLLKEQPQKGENTRKALDLLDELIDELLQA